MTDAGFALEAAAKALFYGALLVAIGTVATRWVILPGAATPAHAHYLSVSAARLGLAASVIALAALTFRAWAHTVTVFGISESLSIESLRVVSLESRWGERWTVQWLVAAGCVSGFLSIWLERLAGWILATIAVLFLTVTVPLLGHAAGEPPKLLLHATHMLAAGTWVGTLAVLILTHEVGESGAELDARPAPFQRFSPLALATASVVAATGTSMAWLYLESASALWTTRYAWLLALKLAVVAGVAACGYSNWQRIRLGLKPMRARLISEVAFACAVVVITAILTETSPEP